MKGDWIAAGKMGYIETEPTVWKKNECNHIIGEAHGVCESWLVQKDQLERDRGYMEVWFKFCPLCGEKYE